MRVNIEWGEDYPAFFLIPEDNWLFDERKPMVDVPNELVAWVQGRQSAAV